LRAITLFTTLILPTLLFSKDYCMYINTLNINSNNYNKIYSILSDVAYPSVKIEKNNISIYSGRFKHKEDATQLLALTKSRYSNAKVSSCENTTKYNGEKLFQSDFNIIEKETKKTPQQTIDKNKYYSLNVFETSLINSSKQKSRIQYILNRLPDTFTKIKDDKFIIYSGKFHTKESAKAIEKILKQEFKNSKVESCEITQKSLKKATKEIKIAYSDNLIKKEVFTISSLDEKGYISKEISSQFDSQIKESIHKSDIQHALDVQKEEYFNGFYLKTNLAYDMLNSDTAYDVRFEFDIFNQGYYQNKKRNIKDKIDNEVVFFRAMKNIEVLQKEQELLKIKKYQNSVNVSALLLKLRLSESDYNSAKEKLNSGLLTEYTYEEYKLSIQKIKDDLLLFKNMTLLKIPNNLWVLFNQIEYVKLDDEKSLLAALEEQSVDLMLAKSLQEKEPLTEEWSDRLRINIYAGQRKMYLSQEQTLVGVEAKIPLSSFSKTKELATIQNDIMSTQMRLQHKQSIERLKDAVATFKYKQQKLKTYAYELSILKKHLRDLEIINNSKFASYANLSFDSTQRTIDNYLNKYTQIQQERIETYKELINIMYLVHSNSLKDILKYAVSR